MRMAAIDVAHRVLSWFVAFVFFSAGIFKLYPFVPEIYKDMVAKFDLYTPVCPTVFFGYTPRPYIYMLTVGSWETFIALGSFIPQLQRVCYGIMAVIMTGAIYTLIAIRNFQEVAIPLTLLIVSLFLYATHKKETEEKKKTD